ncbi:hypothetical protein PANDA_009061, partial [Ailuropoda melanoleuca]
FQMQSHLAAGNVKKLDSFGHLLLPALLISPTVEGMALFT